ncbi:MAG: serine hydrolase [Clostridia bacterium]|nr:serine hydrolase [Clostridia bacterium]
MFEKITPEAAGIRSDAIARIIERINKRNIPIHSLLMMRGDKIFGEFYWEPYHKDYPHRMYSATKSYTALAIGLLADDGKLSLDDKIAELFTEKIHSELSPFIDGLTVREMLTMSTTGNGPSWFTLDDPDRTSVYFNNKKTDPHPSGTVWQYDSAGSQVLAALVDKLAGKPLFDFLRERIFDKLGTFKNASMLRTRNGDSWGDSALLATARDGASVARLLMQGGRWNGEQLISEAFVKEAISPLVSISDTPWGQAVRHGYGYQIWHTERGGFAFNGMGSQLTIGLPSDDIIFAVNADTQGPLDRVHKELIVTMLFDMLEDYTGEALPADAEGAARLAKASESLKLFAVRGMADSPFRTELDGVTYHCRENALGFTEFTFSFKDATAGSLRYTNGSGEKVIPFRVNENEFGNFPELGYSQDLGGTRTTDGSTYRDAVSLAWVEERKIVLHIQIIDRYLGSATLVFGFKGGYATVQATKAGENFLGGYEGIIVASQE